MDSFLENDLTILIPVREGSSRVKEKIYLNVDENITLLEWKISELLKVRNNLRIVVSSNSQNVKAIARNLGVDYHERDQFLCDGHKASFSEVITGIVKDIETKHFAWCTVVVPFMSRMMFEDCFKSYFENVVSSKKFDSLVSVNLIKEYLWWEDRPLNYKADRNHTISQDLPDIYRVTNGLYMRDKLSTLKEGYFLGSNPFKAVVPKIAGIDIDTYEDFELVKGMLDIYKRDYR